MRQYVGHKMIFLVEGFGGKPVSGVMVNEDANTVYIKSEAKEQIWRIPKNKICGFTVTDKEPDEFQPILVLACDCKNIGCPGVQYVKPGPGFSQKDLETFTAQCPCKNLDCRVGSKGEIRGISTEFLRQMLGGMLFGDYPKPKKENKRGNRPDAKADSRPPEDGRSVEGTKPDDGGTGQPPEANS